MQIWWVGVGASVPVHLVLKKFMIFNKNVLLCSPADLQLHSVDKAGLKLKKIHVPLPPQCQDRRHAQL